MRILYVTDLHGMVWKYDKILDLAIWWNVDVVVNGGDMLPKGAPMNVLKCRHGGIEVKERLR